MTLEEEKRFLARFTKTAGAGELLNIGALKIAYEEEIGHPTSDSTIYNLLARHQWRKLMPRPFHPERDEEAQEAYKKKVPPSREEGSAHRRGQRPALASHVRR